MRRRDPHTGRDALPASLSAYEPDPRSLSAEAWEDGYRTFLAARQRWADHRRIDVDDLPDWRIGDAPFDGSDI